jgi:hypothetical protein
LVELEIVDAISHMTVQRVMKKQTTLKNEAYIPEGWDSMSSDANGGSRR